MKIVYFGNNPRGVACLEVLIRNKYDIAAVVVHHRTSNDPCLVSEIAQKNNLPCFDPKDVNSSEFSKILKNFDADLYVLVGYNQILKNNIIFIPKKGIINLHGGRLPFYRGGSPINWQIINGEIEGACTILFVDEGIDTGDILIEESFKIGPNETAGQIHEKVLNIFPCLLLKTLKQINEGMIKPKKQNKLEGNYYCKRYPLDGHINWQQLSAFQVHNLVRGLNGANLPGAFSYLDDQKIVIWKTELIEETILGVPGRIALKKPEGVVVIAKDKGILITEIKDGTNSLFEPNDIFKIEGRTFN